jgi:uncharacterized protein YigA (DUF484 family)
MLDLLERHPHFSAAKHASIAGTLSDLFGNANANSDKQRRRRKMVGKITISTHVV